jgi:hypothetical protein
VVSWEGSGSVRESRLPRVLAIWGTLTIGRETGRTLSWKYDNLLPSALPKGGGHRLANSTGRKGIFNEYK